MSDIEINIKANITKKITIPSFKTTATYATVFISLLLSLGGNMNAQPPDHKNEIPNELTIAQPEHKKLKCSDSVSNAREIKPLNNGCRPYNH